MRTFDIRITGMDTTTTHARLLTTSAPRSVFFTLSGAPDTDWIQAFRSAFAAQPKDFDMADPPNFHGNGIAVYCPHPFEEKEVQRRVDMLRPILQRANEMRNELEQERNKMIQATQARSAQEKSHLDTVAKNLKF